MHDVATGLTAEAPPLELSLLAIFLGVSRLRADASALVSRWNSLDEGARLAALKEIEGRAEQLDARWRRTPDGNSFAPRRQAHEARAGGTPSQVLMEGASTAQAATRLNVSVSTIRSHIKSILAKLGVHSRTEALAFTLRHRLIPLQ